MCPDPGSAVVEMDKTTGDAAAKKLDGVGKDGLDFLDWKWVELLMVSNNNHLPSNVVAFADDEAGCLIVRHY